MAGQTSTDSQFNPYLSSTQQDLLLAALASNNFPGESNGSGPHSAIKRSDSDPKGTQKPPPSFIDGAILDTTKKPVPQQSADYGNYDFDDTSPFIDYLDGDSTLNFDSNDLGGEDMFGSVPGPGTESSGSDKGDRSDKRKSPDDADEDDEDGDAKRREGDDKMAKKPGRKPLTSEPTTKRKAQNRAAQRAFRERKEKHLKDLETKVDGLTKAQEADKHENGILRAQVERLQSELREYKKRMSMNSTGISQSPPLAGSRLNSRSNSKPSSDFQFDFPKFGSLPGSQLFDAQPKHASITPPVNDVSPATHISRQNSAARFASPPKAQLANSSRQSAAGSRSESLNLSNNVPVLDGFDSTLPQMPTSLFTPSILNGTTTDYGFNTTASPVENNNGGDSHSGISRAFRFNSGSHSSNTDSPSVSSQSHFNPNSSCGTSPESSHDSPPEATKVNANAYSFNSNPTNQSTFSNIANTAVKNNNNNNNDFNFDWLASQNGGQFDPVLLGDYRDSQDAIVGDANEFNNGFFNDAFPYDFGSPLNFDFNSPKPQQQQTTQQQNASRNLLAEVDRAREGNDDDFLPGPAAAQSAAKHLSKEQNVPLAQAEKMLNCNTIWSQLQTNPDFKDGKFDLDGLCAELRAKAKCSESGVTVPSDHVDAAFKKLGAQQQQSTKPVALSESANAHYLFDSNSVDEAFKRLSGEI